jgi:glycosyltransferase involved in cell wall biosynthesis
MAARRVLHLVPSLAGGAGRAAWRIHHCLNPAHGASELSSAIRCLDSPLHGPAIQVGYPSRRAEVLAKALERLVSIGSRGFQADPGVFHSFGYPGIGIPKAINQSPVDLVHLHWCGGNLITIEDVAKIRKPIVWTLHDQWAFCGAEHYASLSSTGSYRYVEGYTERNRLPSERGPDLNRLTWTRKKKAWRQPFQIVAPSRWLASCAQQSCLMQHWPVAVIPHPIDTDVWRPLNKAFARDALNLPQDKPIILFGVDTGCAKPNKGADLLMRALSLLKEGDQLATGFELAVFGQMLAQHQLPHGMTYHFLGRFTDDVLLRLAYSAADVLVMPSRVEAFGLTAAEAHACGTPVVCFNSTGLADIVDHGVTGALAEPLDPGSLARAIAWVIEEPERCAHLGQAARRKAEATWAEPLIAKQYLNLYLSVQAKGSASPSRLSLS